MFSKRRLLIVIVLLSLIEYVYGQTYKGPALGVGWGTLLLTVSFLMIAAIWLLTAYSNNFKKLFYIILFFFKKKKSKKTINIIHYN